MALIDDLVAEMRRVMDAHEEYPPLFVLAEGNFEDWYRAEFLMMLHRLHDQQLIDEWETQCSPDSGGGRMDARVKRGDEHIAIELKAGLIGKQGDKDGSMGAATYLDPYYLRKDFEKLSRWSQGRRYVVHFLHKKPDARNWAFAVEKLPSKFPDRSIEVTGQLVDFPIHYFIAVLELK